MAAYYIHNHFRPIRTSGWDSQGLDLLVQTPCGGVAVGADGRIYGTAMHVGTNGFGTVFQLAVDGSVSNVHAFSGDFDGASPLSSLSRSREGTLFGCTSSGGSAAGGTAFELLLNMPRFVAAQLNGQIVHYTGNGGIPHDTYTLLAASELSTPAHQWISIGTNAFDANGAFSFSATKSVARQFFMLLTQ